MNIYFSSAFQIHKNLQLKNKKYVTINAIKSQINSGDKIEYKFADVYSVRVCTASTINTITLRLR